MKIKVCPVCNSRDITVDTLYKFEQRSGLLRDLCKNCNYNGPMTVMEKRKAEKLKVGKFKKNQE